MDVVHRRALPPPRSSSPPSSASGLNPNAPLFVPMAYRSVEDFSDQWWQLVDSSAWFRDYWFCQQQNQQQHQQPRRRNGDLLEEEEGDKERRRDFEAVLLADEDSLFHGYQPAEEERMYARDVAASQGGRWNVPLSTVEERRMFLEKATQMASARNSPWALQRPI